MERSREQMHITGQPGALLFINTAHPSDATTRSSISQIRSHAAKEIRSRVRNSRQAVLSHKDGSENKSLNREEQNATKQGGTPTCFAHALNDDLKEVKLHAPALALLPLPGPLHTIGLPSVARSLGSIRPFSDKEHILLEHCTSLFVRRVHKVFI